MKTFKIAIEIYWTLSNLPEYLLLTSLQSMEQFHAFAHRLSLENWGPSINYVDTFLDPFWPIHDISINILLSVVLGGENVPSWLRWGWLQKLGEGPKPPPRLWQPYTHPPGPFDDVIYGWSLGKMAQVHTIIVVKIHWSESNSVKKKIFRGYKKILNTQKISYSTVI